MKNFRIRRSGAYIIKAAESRPTRVPSKTNGSVNVPTETDKNLVRALISFKHNVTNLGV